MTITNDDLVFIFIDVFVGILIVVGNGLVCYVVFESRPLRKKSMFIFLTSLAVVDLLIGVVLIPFRIIIKLGLPHNSPYLCITMLTFIIVLSQISIFNLMIISIERYWAIRHPHIHFSKLTTKLSLRIIVITWLVSIVFGMLPIAWNKLPKRSEDSNEVVETNNITSVTSLSNATHECHFLSVMSLDYMFFNFIVGVLIPLLVCAVLYSIILLSLVRVQSPTDKNSMHSNKGSMPTTSTFILTRIRSSVCKNNDIRAEKELQQKVCAWIRLKKTEKIMKHQKI